MRALLQPDADPRYHWGAFLSVQGILAAQGRVAEIIDLTDSLIDAGTAVARIAYVLDAIAGVDIEAKAQEVSEYARSMWGQDYSGIRSHYLLWLFGVWHGHLGEADKVRVLPAADARG